MICHIAFGGYTVRKMGLFVRSVLFELRLSTRSCIYHTCLENRKVSFSFSSLFVFSFSPLPSPFFFFFFVPNWKLMSYRQNRPFLEVYISLSFVVDYSRNFSSLGFRLVNTKCMVLVDMWKKIQHSNIVTLREVFTTKAFAEPCKLLVLWWFCSWVSLYGVGLVWCVFLFFCKLLCSHMISMLEEKLWWADTLMTLMQMPTSQRESGVREMWADYALMHAFLLGNNSFVLK